MSRRRAQLASVQDGPPIPALPTVDTLTEDRVSDAHPAILLPRLLQVAQERQRWLATLLAGQIEAEGLQGIVGESYAVTADGESVRMGEHLRALYVAEQDERERCAALAERIARLGLDQGLVMRDTARWIARALETLTNELGLSFKDNDVLRTARRAGLTARRSMGHDDGDIDTHAGPRLTAAERARILREAAEKAQRDADTLAALEAETDAIR